MSFGVVGIDGCGVAEFGFGFGGESVGQEFLAEFDVKARMGAGIGVHKTLFGPASEMCIRDRSRARPMNSAVTGWMASLMEMRRTSAEQEAARRRSAARKQAVW